MLESGTADVEPTYLPGVLPDDGTDCNALFKSWLLICQMSENSYVHSLIGLVQVSLEREASSHCG